MKWIQKFVNANRRLSKKLGNRYAMFEDDNERYRYELIDDILYSIKNNSLNSVLEIGGIDRPLLEKGNGYKYDGLDIESKESCFDIYDTFFVQSIENPVNKKYDCIISITLLEHVPDNSAAFNSIFSALNNPGFTYHYIPSKWHPYAMILRIIGPSLQKRLIPILRPGTENITGYPTFFDNCSTSSMRRLLKKNRFSNIEIKAYYRANDYFSFFVPAFLLVSLFENMCKYMNWELFASGFIVSAKK